MKWSDVGKIVGDTAPLIGTLLGGPAGGTIGALVSRVLNCKNDPEQVYNLLKDNPEAILKIKQAEIEHDTELAKLAFQSASAQIQVNLQEAKSPKLFISGWRPAVGWICAIGLLYSSVVQNIIAWVAKFYNTGITPPSLDTTTLMSVLFGMLGLAGYRTYEKVKDVQGKH